MQDGPNIMEMYEKWTDSVFDSISRAGSSSLDTVNDILINLVSGSNIYTNLFEIWLPLCRATQEKFLNPEEYAAMLDPAAYKKFLDRVFAFVQPEKILQLYDQWVKALLAMSKSFLDYSGPWKEAYEKNMQSLPQFIQGHPEAFLTIYHNLFSAFDNTVGRIFHVPAVGKDREKIEFALRGLDNLNVYLTKSIHYQHILYGTGMQAMEKVVRAFADRIRGGEEMKSFDEFLNTWVDLNEREFVELFRTEYFARAQSEMMEAALKVRRDFNRQMELYLYDLPVTLRSETKDLYRTVHDLKRRVKGLEKELKENQRKEALKA